MWGCRFDLRGIILSNKFEKEIDSMMLFLAWQHYHWESDDDCEVKIIKLSSSRWTHVMGAGNMGFAVGSETTLTPQLLMTAWTAYVNARGIGAGPAASSSAQADLR